MKKERLELLIELAEELYIEELKKNGDMPVPYAWMKNELMPGTLVIVSMFGKYSKAIEENLGNIEW